MLTLVLSCSWADTKSTFNNRWASMSCDDTISDDMTSQPYHPTLSLDSWYDFTRAQASSAFSSATLARKFAYSKFLSRSEI